MLKLFGNKSKVKAGKQTQVAAASKDKQKKSPLAGFGTAWNKLNHMNRKQAYTWGAVILVAAIGLLTLFSMAVEDKEDFTEFETRGYDLANMPFSTDEAEKYLLAAKYPDMKGKKAPGLYSEAEKAERQEDDAEAAAQAAGESGEESDAYGGGYGGYAGGGAGGGRGGRAPTQIGQLGRADRVSASGSAMEGTFGPTGDFSNFRSQDKGYDQAPATPGTGNARKALYQAAMGSRAAAGLKNDKLANAKKAMMGGRVKGSEAFMDENGAANTALAGGLELDPNAPVSSADLSGMDDALDNAAKDAEKDAKDQEKTEWWETMLQEAGKQLISGLIDMGIGAGKDAMKAAQAERNAEVGQANVEKANAITVVDQLAAEGKAIHPQPGDAITQDHIKTLTAEDRHLGVDMPKGWRVDENGKLVHTQGHGLFRRETVYDPDSTTGQYKTSDGKVAEWGKGDCKHIESDFYNKGYPHTEAGKNSQARIRQAGADARKAANPSKSGAPTPNTGHDMITVDGVAVWGKRQTDGTFLSDNGVTYKPGDWTK